MPVLMPTNRPSTSTSAPPELPGLIAGVRLDEILVIGLAIVALAVKLKSAATEGAHDPHGRGPLQAEGIADGQNHVADLPVDRCHPA